MPSLCLDSPLPPVLGCSQPTRGPSQAPGSHPSSHPLESLGPAGFGGLPRHPTPQPGPPCRGGPAPEETATLLAGGPLHAWRSTTKALRANGSTLPAGSAPPAGKRDLEWEDTVSGQHLARQSCFCCHSATLLATSTTSLSRENSSTCT